MTFKSLVEAYEASKQVKYQVNYLPVAGAAEIEKQKKLEGDVNGERLWSIRTLVASGFGRADGVAGSKLDNNLFDFVPETAKRTFERIHA